MPSIIPKAYYCAQCKTELKKKVCDCGAKCKPLPPYTVRFRWVNENGEEEHKRLTGTPPWTSRALAQKGYEQWIAEHPTHRKIESFTLEFMPLYEEYRAHLQLNVKESSYVTMLNLIEKFAVPVFKDKKVTEITSAEIVKWQNDLSDRGYSYKYKASIRGAFNHFFEYLKIYNIPNPIANVKGFKSNKTAKREMVYWTLDEFQQFISHVDILRYKAVFTYLYLTGCRKGEACAIKWSDIDFTGATVKINKTLTRIIDKKRKKNEGEVLSDMYRVTTPKTENSYREIILPQVLLDLLKELKAQSTSDFVFGQNNYFMPFQTLQHAFERYTNISGVKRIRIHDLRHSHTALLINKGENQLSTIYVIAARLGDSVEMIFKTYGHLFPNTQRDIIQRLNIAI